MSKARLIKRKDALMQAEQRQEPARSTVSLGTADPVTKAINEYRRAKQQNPRKAFFDLFQQQHSD